MSKEQIQVGDRIRFRDWDDMAHEFGINSYGNINLLFSFTCDMKYLCGQSGTVESIENTFEGPMFRITLDDSSHDSSPVNWSISRDMIKKTDDETDDTSFVSNLPIVSFQDLIKELV